LSAAKLPLLKLNLLPLRRNQQLNQSLIDKAYALAGIKGYVTNLDIPSQQVMITTINYFKLKPV